MDDIIPGIISGNEEDIDSILLDLTAFDKRTMTNNNNGTDKQQHPEHMKTIKDRSNTGGWSKPTEEVAYTYLKDLERSLRKKNDSLWIQKVEEGITTSHDLIRRIS